MASTVFAPLHLDPIARTAPRLSVVSTPQIVTAPPAPADAAVAAAPGAAPAASTRARFRRLVVFTGLS
jgi:hypothetical protein